MRDANDIRECYVALGRLGVQTSGASFGAAAAEFLATVAGALHAQYWELSVGADAFVLAGEARFGDSVNRTGAHSLTLSCHGRSRCPFDLVALAGQSVALHSNAALDLTRLDWVLGVPAGDASHLVPLCDTNGNLFGCALLVEVLEERMLAGTEFRIACQTLVQMAERHHTLKAALQSNRELTMALRRFDQDKRQKRAAHGKTLSAALPGRSPAMRALRDRIQIVAKSRAPVLISTPAGDSAEPIVRELHQLGASPDAALVTVPAVSLSGDRLSVELFGHKRGIIPGVAGARRGLLREVGDGIVLLDRIEELDVTGQEQILRLLQSQSFRPFGSSRDHDLTARVAISYRRDAVEHDGQTKFLPALYFELKPTELVLPPLSRTAGDAIDILWAQMDRAGYSATEVEYSTSDTALVKALVERADEYGRDSLAALIRAALQVASEAGEPLNFGHLASLLMSSERPSGDGMPTALSERMARYEAEQIADALARFDGRRADAAQWLSLPKRTLADKCLRYGL